MPSCTINANVSGRDVTFGLTVEDGDVPGSYSAESAEYNFGDGSTEADGTLSQQPHRYAEAGTYTVRASAIMDVAGVDVQAPFPDEQGVPCEPITVTVQ